jgi:tight adherence protein C
MSGILGISFGLSIFGFEFDAPATILLVVAAATALVSFVMLIRVSSRENLQQRVANLRGAIVVRTESARATLLTQRAAPMTWYDRVGAMLANGPLVGAAEQRKLAAQLTLAGIGGPGRVATLIGLRFLFGIGGGVAVWLALTSVEFAPKYDWGRYFIMAFGIMLGWRLPDIVVGSLARRRKLRLELGFPDALDLLVICAEAGLGLEQAIGQVAYDLRHATPDVAAEFAIAAAEMRVLADRRVALEHLAERTGLETLKGMISVLNQSIRFGTPLSEALRQLTAEARMVRIARLEEKGARLSVTLLLPMMGFIMPSLFLVICGPIALRAIDIMTSFMGK